MKDYPAKAKAFRKELHKLMPGYKWTIHRQTWEGSTSLEATGIQSSGSNRLSTLQVMQIENDLGVTYTSRSSGYGVKSDWLTKEPIWGATLAQSLRHLQQHYESTEQIYRAAANSIKDARANNHKGETNG
jgi:hypothetical protein